MAQKIDRLNEIKINNQGYLMKIIEYKDRHNIKVEFQDEYKVILKCDYKQFEKGTLENPFHKTIFNIGFLGQGKYSPMENKKKTKCYLVWKSMLERCYNPYYINKHLTYIDCYVCEEWHNFQNFARWYEEKYYEIKEERMELDKDILFKDNKIYSPKTCVFVPRRINLLFVKQSRKRGKFPIGVNYNKRDDILEVHCNIYEDNKRKNIYLGRFPLDKQFQAFTMYKNFKENYIKQVANEYKNLIPQKLYKAMYEYKVEIND